MLLGTIDIGWHVLLAGGWEDCVAKEMNRGRSDNLVGSVLALSRWTEGEDLVIFIVFILCCQGWNQISVFRSVTPSTSLAVPPPRLKILKEKQHEKFSKGG